MNEALVSYGIPAVFIIGFLIFKRLGQISPDRAKELVKGGAKLVDVRSPGEFSSGHLPGALNVPLQEVGARADRIGPKDAPVVVYCASGTRSAMARSTLTRMGFKRVFNLGAISRW
jgi:rhodanese-related sulfurtransferase